MKYLSWEDRELTEEQEGMLERLVEMREGRREQGFIQDFQLGGGGGEMCVWVNWDGEYFSQVTPRNGAKSIVVSFC